MTRGLAELIDRADPGLPIVQEWIAEAACLVEILPCTPAAGDAALLGVQVTTRSPLGAICHGTGGILVDDGWLRILGAGCARLPRSLPGWNAGKFPTDGEGRAGALLIADDVVGGFFALNGGGIANCATGSVAYFAPDTLKWEDLGCGYSPFLCWGWSGRLAEFSRNFRWEGWRDEVRALGGDKVIGIAPPVWAAGPPIAGRSRRPVPVAEVWGMNGGASLE